MAKTDKEAADDKAVAKAKNAFTLTIEGEGGLGCGAGTPTEREVFEANKEPYKTDRQVPCNQVDCRECTAARLIAALGHSALITKATFSGADGDLDILHRGPTEEKPRAKK